MKQLTGDEINRYACVQVILLFTSALLVLGCTSRTNTDGKMAENKFTILAGSYSGDEGNDIHILELDDVNGELKLTGGIRVGDNPSFIALSPDGSRLYAVNETDNFAGTVSGGITTLAFNPENSEFDLLGKFNISGKGPCHLSVTEDGDFLYSSNYSDGSFSVVVNNGRGIPELETIFLKYGSSDSADSHTHMSFQQQGTNLLYVSDLGLDRLMIYHIIRSGENIILREDHPINMPPGSGPRHFIIDTTGTVIYILNELSSDISVVKRYVTGDYREIQRISTLPAGFEGENYPADIHWSPDGRFVYTTNRGHNSIALFEAGDDDRLEFRGTVPCGGDWPRNFAISPDGRYLVVANQRSGSLDLFTIDRETFMPVYSGNSVMVNSPSCVIFAPVELN